MGVLRAHRSVFLLITAIVLASPCISQQESLGDVARKVRDNKKDDVLVNKDDAKELFQSISKIMAFSSEDSGFGRRTAVNHKMVGRADVERHFAEGMKDAIREQHLEESQLVLKKFGMLPPDFDLATFEAKNSAKSLGGFYDFRDKTMYLLNWIPVDAQKAIMAHELTHALQDQNFNLMRFQDFATGKEKPQGARMAVDEVDRGEMSSARRAVVEGQATIVYYDYKLEPYHANLSDGSGVLDYIKDAITSSYDNEVVFHNAPRLLRETSIFPYREGFAFELELLKRGGRSMAFSGPYSRPPRDTHEILQPEAYISGSHVAPVKIPDLAPIMGSAYEAYDSGTMGELDVQVMAQEFGIDNDIYSVARKWNGGAYVALKKTSHPKDAAMTTADLAVVYLSKWATEKAATRFAEIYMNALGKRVRITESPTISTHDCEAARCPSPLWEAHLVTTEGPVNLEVWPKATLLITESIDDATVSKMRIPLLVPPGGKRTTLGNSSCRSDELATRLFNSPGFAALGERWAVESLVRATQKIVRPHE